MLLSQTQALYTSSKRRLDLLQYINIQSALVITRRSESTTSNRVISGARYNSNVLQYLSPAVMSLLHHKCNWCAAIIIRIRNVFIRSYKKCIQSNNETILDQGTPIKTSLVANIRAAYYIINHFFSYHKLKIHNKVIHDHARMSL